MVFLRTCLMLLLALGGSAYAASPKIMINYGEPGPSAGPGFGAVKALQRSRANEAIKSDLEGLRSVIHGLIGPDYQHGNSARIVIDVAAMNYGGPVVIDQQTQDEMTDVKVRVRISRHSADIESATYVLKSKGDVFFPGVRNAVLQFLAIPKVTSYLAVDQKDLVVAMN